MAAFSVRFAGGISGEYVRGRGHRRGARGAGAGAGAGAGRGRRHRHRRAGAGAGAGTGAGAGEKAGQKNAGRARVFILMNRNRFI